MYPLLVYKELCTVKRLLLKQLHKQKDLTPKLLIYKTQTTPQNDVTFARRENSDYYIFRTR